MNPVDIHKMMPNAGARLDPHIPFIGPALEWGGLGKDATELAAFFAHLAHESGEYRYMEELASGAAYEGRDDLGNTEPGDGVKFKGHGPIQITGRDAHRACGEALGIDLIAEPTLLTQPEYGTLSAVWFWTKYKPSLGPAARAGWFHVTQRLVNGGENGWVDRLNYYLRNLQLFGLPPYVEITEASKIADFQRAHGLMADGIAGKRTLAALALA